MKANLVGASGIDISTLTSKTDLAGMKTKIDNLDVDELKNAPADLSKLSDVVDNKSKKLYVINW